jgi:exonuclease VII large subunit
MSTPTNELDALLMESLQQLSAEFQQREMRLAEQQKSCIDSFTEQHDAITKRLDELTQHYKDTQALMQRVVKQLNALSEKLK